MSRRLAAARVASRDVNCPVARAIADAACLRIKLSFS